MDDVAVSSLRAFPEASCQAMIKGEACSIRVLRRLGPLAAIGGSCCFTGRALRGRGRHTRFGGQAMQTKRRARMIKATRGDRLANRELGTPNLSFTRSIRRT